MNAGTVDDKPSIALCTLGDEGHGKTALTAAILQVLAKTGGATPYTYEQLLSPPEPEQRGCFSPGLPWVEYTTAHRRYCHLDSTRHADRVRALIAGLTQMEGALLVVSVTAGPMPRAREHLRLARQLGVPAPVVFLNKVDLVDGPARREQVEQEVRELLTRSGFPGDTLPIIPGSALKALEGETSEMGEGAIVKLLEAMDRHFPTPPRVVDGPLLMPVEDMFFPSGQDPVLGGAVARGVLRVGDEVEAMGLRAPRRWVVTGMESYRKPVTEGRAGAFVCVRMRGLERGDVECGQVLARPGSITAHSRCVALFYVWTELERGREESLRAGYWSRPSMVHSGRTTATVRLPDGVERVMPGEHLVLEVEFSSPVALETGMRFTLQERKRFVGRGVVIEPLP